MSTTSENFPEADCSSSWAPFVLPLGFHDNPPSNAAGDDAGHELWGRSPVGSHWLSGTYARGDHNEGSPPEEWWQETSVGSPLHNIPA
jgi:hypothetical protein